MGLKAPLLLAENIKALLRARGYEQTDLAQWCHHSDEWLSFILGGKRGLRVKDLDRVADFFGLEAHELLRPGIATVSERRSGRERRTFRERRVGRGPIQSDIDLKRDELELLIRRLEGSDVALGIGLIRELAEKRIAEREQATSAAGAAIRRARAAEVPPRQKKRDQG